MEIEKIKENLIREKENLEKQIKYYQSEDPFLTEDRDMTSTLDDDITENEGHDRITAAKNELVAQLGKLNNALERVYQGTYGICTKCGTQISEERLSVMPTAQLCMDCEKSN
ncbi:MAG: hypothetical protein A3F33_01025 [Candidatus Woykebacteria bacterium RIFCSPHIGHO2_12_FULL_43_10]|uniref:Zinc finger DksA/TraR C4-type domain-containing protein n=2 Tax=Candidatus Woykeibacteriota TaxID=1817899 RepID=A0A1G1WXE8_9BACT|nr:MAG: hypothetical protein A2802_00670 [Candidatus Woykebacteria bacterium RIFCSPHIGHO2_01_FULL_43_29]OGY29188.1 MAG: hypothetical protein A3F33_01025 [Candidatus Woykebacteria bacterium RIFCSPHIGHO2_12_FULL_43_10]OGY30001.1 MAG: hypothetical protein A3J50_02875 [Candidatus Woykebacteria bacterium RIFCSPHIGHO2_02_FULL_43_16b]OGY32010.1 MAG: hypothetical protein A3A61_01160 [Candidatus Woykebacteria bacterium RIFCSPLOWO2_01_FULL_43_14]